MSLIGIRRDRKEMSGSGIKKPPAVTSLLLILIVVVALIWWMGRFGG